MLVQPLCGPPESLLLWPVAIVMLLSQCCQEALQRWGWHLSLR